MKRGFLIAGLMLGAAVAGQCQSAAPGAYASIFRIGLATSIAQAGTVPLSTAYYFPHLAMGGGFQSVLTLVNYSPQAVTCQTNFLADDGTPLPDSFGGAAPSSRTDLLPPGGTVHQTSQTSAAG